MAEAELQEPFDKKVFKAFWAGPDMDFQMAGLDILRRQAKKCKIDDIALIENWVNTFIRPDNERRSRI